MKNCTKKFLSWPTTAAIAHFWNVRFQVVPGCECAAVSTGPFGRQCFSEQMLQWLVKHRCYLLPCSLVLFSNMSLPLLFTGWSYNNNVLGGTRWTVSRLLWPKQEGSRNSWFNCCTHEVTQEEVARVVSPDTGLPCEDFVSQRSLYNMTFISWDHRSA